VGTTDTTPYNNSANSSADNGIALGSSGILSVSKHNDSPIIANRTGSDGGVIKLHKSGVDRGGIGLNNGDPYISRASGSGMRWYNGAVVPTNEIGNDSNNTMDLGSSGVRFKHGYFSGNLYGDGSNLTGISSGGTTFLGSVFVTNASASSISISNLDLSDYKQVYIAIRFIGANSSQWFGLQGNSEDQANGIIQSGGADYVGTSLDITCDLASAVAYSSASRLAQLNNASPREWRARYNSGVTRVGGNPANEINNSTTTISLHLRSGYNFAYLSENMGTGDRYKRGMYLYGVK
jgi:hypothetical protein